MKAYLKQRKEGGNITDFSNLTKKVPLLAKGQVSQVIHRLRRHIKYAEWIATAESEAPVQTLKMPEEVWIRLERIRLMEILEDGVSHLGAKPERLQREKAEVPQGNAGTIHADANLARD